MTFIDKNLHKEIKNAKSELLNSLALYLELHGLVHSQGTFLDLIDKEIREVNEKMRCNKDYNRQECLDRIGRWGTCAARLRG